MGQFQVILSRKGAKSRTRGRKLRSSGTKARARVSNGPNSLIELKKQLGARTRELAEARGHLSEALEQQAATSEVLRVISSSSGELAPVFESLLASAKHLCGAEFGVIEIDRQEVRPLTDKQIELVKNFAAQAVIAIENTRLLDELRQRTDDLSESLEQQIATSEVLRVISSSPGELEPVFQAMLENAVRICEAKFGTMYRYDSDMFHPTAVLNAPPALSEFLQQRGAFQPPSGTPLHRLLRTKSVVHSADDSAEQVPSPSAKLGGARSHIAVPMRSENEVIGAIIIYRQEVRPFTDKQIELVSNFAKQAVIAIENTRLLKELRETLQRQTATADVLKVISRSTCDMHSLPDALAPAAAPMWGDDSG